MKPDPKCPGCQGRGWHTYYEPGLGHMPETCRCVYRREPEPPSPELTNVIRVDFRRRPDAGRS